MMMTCMEAIVSVAIKSVTSDLKIRKKITVGYSCSINCISQFNAEEVFLYRLLLSEMKKYEKDMIILGKLQVSSKGVDSLPQHAHAKKRRKTNKDYL